MSLLVSGATTEAFMSTLLSDRVGEAIRPHSSQRASPSPCLQTFRHILFPLPSSLVHIPTPCLSFPPLVSRYHSLTPKSRHHETLQDSLHTLLPFTTRSRCTPNALLNHYDHPRAALHNSNPVPPDRLFLSLRQQQTRFIPCVLQRLSKHIPFVHALVSHDEVGTNSVHIPRASCRTLDLVEREYRGTAGECKRSATAVCVYAG